MTEEKNYYEVLGVSETADENEIRARYIALLRKHHPDQNVGLSESEIIEREKIFKEVSEAGSVLTKSERRRAYDLYLKVIKKSGNIYKNYRFRYEDFSDLNNNFSYNSNSN